MLPAKPFYLIRHGESVSNAARITAGGGTDSPLTARGRGQAEFLAPALPAGLAVKPATLYHSPMIRARDTAMILNGPLKLPAVEIETLREHHMGAWEGLPWADVEPQLESGETPPGGESEAQFAQRIQATFEDILARETLPPLIVAHGGLFHAMGFMYEYAMSEVRNCHLHYFEPWPAFRAFPWRVWQFDPVDGGGLEKQPAPFCLSATMREIVT